MINKKDYIKPLAEITKFECADVITASSTALKEKPLNAGTKDYVRIGGANWGEGFGRQ